MKTFGTVAARLDIYCERSAFRRNIAVLMRGRLAHHEDGDTVLVADPLNLRQVPYEEAVREIPCEPTFTLTEGDAQLFMDELWRCGVRPGDGTGSTGQLAATERHLEDLRRLVFEGAKRPSEGG